MVLEVSTMLFSKKKKKSPAPKKETGVLWQKEFIQSESYKGYRKIKLSRYYHEQIDKSMAYFVKHNYDMNGRAIKLTCTRFDKDRPDGCRIDVRVAGKLIGTVWQSDEQQWPMLTEYDFDAVYVRIDDTWPDCPPDSHVVHTKAYLFVHYSTDAPIKITVE